jgi:hypothetical protein
MPSLPLLWRWKGRSASDTAHRYRRATAGFPDAYDAGQWESIAPARLGNNPLGELIESIATDLNTIRHLIVFETDQLLDGFQTAMRTRAFKLAALCTRALLERAAVTESHFVSIKALEAVPKMRASELSRPPMPETFVRAHLVPRYTALQSLRKCLAAQTFNWEVVEQPEASISVGSSAKRQFSAGKAVGRLGWTGASTPNRNLYWWYSLLCDYVHPNVGAAHLFVDEQETFQLHSLQGQENRMYRRRYHRAPQHPSALAHVLTVFYLSRPRSSGACHESGDLVQLRV